MQDRIYDTSPLLLQNALVATRGYVNNVSRYGGLYHRHRAFLRSFDTWTLDEQLEHQAAELRKFLKFAASRSAFYRDLYRGVNVERVRVPGDLVHLPVVDKETLRANIGDANTVVWPSYVEGHTGGTTGKSLVVRFTRGDMMRRMAALDHFKARVGFQHRLMRRATFNGKHIVPPAASTDVFWRYNPACRQLMFSSFHLTEEHLSHYVKELNKFKPHALDGFFSSMCDVASFIERNGIGLEFSPIAIFPTSETLTPTGRALLERVFGSKVYDQYASSEGAPFVTECPNQMLHVDLSSGVFERLDDSGEVLVTSFTSHGTPLIRYRIGDRMSIDGYSKCSCGLQAPTVRGIEGRRLDYLLTASGSKINAGNAANLFKNMPNAIIRAQLRQTRLGEVRALLEVDPRRYSPKYDELLRSEFRHKFGEATTLVIEHVESLPRESSGKFRFIVNDVDLVEKT